VTEHESWCGKDPDDATPRRQGYGSPTAQPSPPSSHGISRPLDDLRTTGLLWLINTSVLHPRGYAMALHFNDDGICTGWSLIGDGSEPWVFADNCHEEFADVTRLLWPGIES